MRFDYLFNAPRTPRWTRPRRRPMARAARARRQLQTSRLGHGGRTRHGRLPPTHRFVGRSGRSAPRSSVDLLQLRQIEDELDPGVVEEEAARLSASWDEPLESQRTSAPVRAARPGDASDPAAIRVSTRSSCESVEGVSPAGHDSQPGVHGRCRYIDENDMLNLTAQLMLRSLAGSTPSFLEHYEHHPDWILLGVDGYVPDDWVEGRPRVKTVSSVATARPSGVAQCSAVRLTLACLGRGGARRQLPRAPRYG